MCVKKEEEKYLRKLILKWNLECYSKIAKEKYYIQNYAKGAFKTYDHSNW